MKLFFSAACWRRDKNVVHDVVAQDRKQLAYVDVALKADAEFMYSLICRDWKTIAHAAPGLKADATFMLDAVRNHTRTLQFADDTLKDSEDFMLKAMDISVDTLAHISSRLQHDDEFFVQAGVKNLNALGYAAEDVLGNYGVVEDIQENLNVVHKDHRIYITDRQKALRVLKYARDAFPLVSKDLYGDKDVMLEAWKENMDIRDETCPFFECDEALYNDEDFMFKLLVKVPSVAKDALKLHTGNGFSLAFYEEACRENPQLRWTLPRKVLVALVGKLIDV